MRSWSVSFCHLLPSQVSLSHAIVYWSTESVSLYPFFWQASKAEVAEVALVLALHAAHYRQRYGDVSIEESLQMLCTEKIIDEQARILADGIGVVAEVLKALATPEGER